MNILFNSDKNKLIKIYFDGFLIFYILVILKSDRVDNDNRLNNEPY